MDFVKLLLVYCISLLNEKCFSATRLCLLAWFTVKNYINVKSLVKHNSRAGSRRFTILTQCLDEAMWHKMWYHLLKDKGNSRQVSTLPWKNKAVITGTKMFTHLLI